VPAVFVNQYGTRLSTVGIYKIIERIGKNAGLPYKLGPECLRHTFAIQMLNKGAELKFVCKNLGVKYSKSNFYKVSFKNTATTNRKAMGD